ncbi:MAG: hypothetical protein ABII68_01660 [Pseudomonadota bacterium]
MPDLYFFRHVKGISGVEAGRRFGNRYFYKWWKKASANLGIEGVDLYGGTKHTTATALSKVLTPEQIKRGGTGHNTNKAFERYLQPNIDESLMVARTATKLVEKKSEVAKFRKQ